jgi:hypothetical protein
LAAGAFHVNAQAPHYGKQPTDWQWKDFCGMSLEQNQRQKYMFPGTVCKIVGDDTRIYHTFYCFSLILAWGV